MVPSASRSLAKMENMPEGRSNSELRKLIISTSSVPVLVRFADQKGVEFPAATATTLHPRASLPVASVHVMSSVVDVVDTSNC